VLVAVLPLASPVQQQLLLLLLVGGLLGTLLVSASLGPQQVQRLHGAQLCRCCLLAAL
jgi:hypothetical protein